MKVFKKIMIGGLSLVGVLGATVGGVIGVNAPANGKAMNESVETFCDTVGKYYSLSEVDCGDYRKLKLFGVMKFNVKQYDVEGIGNLSVMTTNMGVMQMATVVLTPIKRDIPLISMDYMYMLGKRTAYVEFYDLVLNENEEYSALLQKLGTVLEQYAELETATPTAAWYDTFKTIGFYKKGSKADDTALIEMLKKGLETVMEYGQTLPELATDAQKEKAALQKKYSDGLIDNGGVSTDIFLKALGEEETRKFFDGVLFKAE